MTRDNFKQFVEDELEGVIALAEERSGMSLSRNIAFQWLSSESEPMRIKLISGPSHDSGWSKVQKAQALLTRFIFGERRIGADGEMRTYG